MSFYGYITADYAKSSRSTCRACKVNIAQGALRLGLEQEVGSHTELKWYCAECFPGGKIMRTASLVKVKGIRDIQKKDQDILKKIFARLKADEESKVQTKKQAKNLSSSKAATKTATTSRAARSTPPAKKAGKAAAGSSFKGYTSAQYKEYKELKEEFFEEKINELKERLRTNNQKTTGTKAELVERIADGKVLGAIPKCQICGGGQPRFNNKTGGYVCPGYMEDDEFQHCGKKFEFDDIERVTWQD